MTDTNPDLSTLPQRMRYVATVLKEANEWREREPHEHLSPFAEFAWTPYLLSTYADTWEGRDRKEAEGAALIEKLDTLLRMFEQEPRRGFSRQTYIARQLIALGWHDGPNA